MIGLTLVTVVAVLGAGLRDSQEGAVKEQLHAGYVIDGKQQEPFRAEEGDALARVPGVKAASHVRSDTVLVGADELQITGIDPATIAQFLRFDWVKGSEQALGQLGADGAVVTKDYAENEHLALGDRLSITTASGEKSKAVLRGIYEPPKGKTLLGDVSISQQGFDAIVPQPKNMFTFLDADDSAAAGLKTAVADFGDASYHTGAAYPKDSTKDMATLLAMLYVLLGFSVIVSLFGMVNTLVLSVFERTRELGMLRTIGMTRRQARRMIRHESIITALIGAVLGLGLGVFLAALVTQAMSSYGVSLVAADPDAGGLHARRDPRRRRRGDHARTAGLAAQRARRAPLRVDGGHDDDRDPQAVRDPCRPAAHAAGRPDSRDPHLPDRARPDRAARARRQLRAAAAGHVARRPSRQRPRAARRARPRGVGVPAPARRPPRRPVAVPRRARHRRRRRGDPLHADARRLGRRLHRPARDPRRPAAARPRRRHAVAHAPHRGQPLVALPAPRAARRRRRCRRDAVRVPARARLRHHACGTRRRAGRTSSASPTRT